MKASLHIDLMHVFGIASSPPSNCQLPFIQMKNADVSYHRCAIGEAMLQEFDGLLGYLYQLDLCTTRALTIPISVDRGDLHALYLILAAGPIHIQDLQSGQSFILASQRACYLYLPPGRYELTAPSYHTALFGYYFRGELFRQGNERPFKLLHPLIQSYRQADSRSCCSIDFRVGPRTHRRIRNFVNNLRKGQLDNEGYIFHQLKELFKLSTEKIFEEHDKLSEPFVKAREARDLIIQYMEDLGQDFSLTSICESIGISQDYLNEIFHDHYQQSPSAFKQQLLEEKIKQLLLEDMPIRHVAYACGYTSGSALNKFFKKRTGMTPSAYIANANKL
ncbi:helix-turn-helix domain-containing protein [Sphingobacterium sp. SYP-B4668]|uniref:helix-turn-helix domain-containing protein n=1 Tax=Sphingobacterium sp. SYP-B4668 TaxID=2996035 RepID=UPI0022DE2D79|nr:helix-turn-helix domain-containing protein [Sphingobacterium sp. SYP-B4668]